MKSALTEKWIVCRICLQQPNERMQTIFNSDASKDLTQMIFECGGVPIKQYDHYPDKICSKCLKYLRVSFKFRQICQRSYKHLSRFIAPVIVDNKSIGEAEDLTGEGGDETINAVVEEYAGDASLIFDEDEDSKNEILLHLDRNISVKEEFSEPEDDVVDVFTPMDDDFEHIEDFDSLDREISNASDVVEYLEEMGNDNSTEDDDFITIRKGLKKGPRGRQTEKQEGMEKKYLNKASTSRASGALNPRGKRPPRSKDDKLNKSFICDVCGNVYPTQGRLKEHIKSHNGVKPYECEICGYAFAQNQQLARHMNTHTGNRPYKCNYCPSAFADLSTRNKHHRIHTNERPYVCDVCGKAFSYTNTLKFHKMIHTGEKPFVCDICGKGFHQAYKLRNHKVTHEKRGHIAAKVEMEPIEGFQEVHDAASQLLGI